MELFLFHDGIEEILLVAKDREDAFSVIEEAYGKEAADELILSKLFQYPQDFRFNSGTIALDVIQRGRGVKAHIHLDYGNSRIERPAA